MWSVNYCREYFLKEGIVAGLREREARILKEMPQVEESLSGEMLKVGPLRYEGDQLVEKVRLLDVGSCFNPFQEFTEFDVTAVDIAPAVDEVFECDFLNVNVADERSQSTENPREIIGLPRAHFDVIVFSLLLEYLPTSDQRIACCEKAYRLLRKEGLLIVITPDSKHVGANAKLMKTWRYALALMGFQRIKIEKLQHITCIVFRQALSPEVAKRWARMHKEDYMNYKIEIPQDFNDEDESDEEDSTDQTGADQGTERDTLKT